MPWTNTQAAQVQARYKRWWDRKLGRAMIGYSRGIDSVPGANPYNHWTAQYPFDQPASQVVQGFQALVDNTEYLADGYPSLFPNFGPGVLAVALGAKPDIQPSTVWFEPIPNADVTNLAIRFNPDHSWWRRIMVIQTTACKLLNPSIPVAFTDIGGNLDILASLVGTQQLLMELHDHPDDVERLVNQITEVWMEGYRQQYELISRSRSGTCAWAPTLWGPGKTYMLQCDFSYMISPAMFERFVLPDLVRCCEYLDYGFYHLDGPGELPHLPLLLKIERLRGIQWITGDGNPPPNRWLEVLKKIVDAGKLVQVFVKADQALEILNQFPNEFFSLHLCGGEPKDVERVLEKAS